MLGKQSQVSSWMYIACIAAFSHQFFVNVEGLTNIFDYFDNNGPDQPCLKYTRMATAHTRFCTKILMCTPILNKISCSLL